MMENSSSSSARVPPGFRFHPTDEELINFYLKKKVAMAQFNLDHVIPEVDLNKLEPWDLREKCKVDASHQTEWYFFSHKDKKYPTGTRTNRATAAGFWKATGRDKCVLSNAHRIGMRKTLVFYRGRAPHGKKTDWIMHEYRLEDKDYDQSKCTNNEEGWVVCRVFKKRILLERGSHGSSSNNVSDEESPITAPQTGKYKRNCVNFPCKVEAMDEASPFLQLPQLENSDIATAPSSTATIPISSDFIKRNLTEGCRDSIDLLPSLSSDNDTEECENKPFFPIMDEFIYSGQLTDGWSLYDSITRYQVPEFCNFSIDLPQTPQCLMSGKIQQPPEFPSSCEVDLWNFTR